MLLKLTILFKQGRNLRPYAVTFSVTFYCTAHHERVGELYRMKYTKRHRLQNLCTIATVCDGTENTTRRKV